MFCCITEISRFSRSTQPILVCTYFRTKLEQIRTMFENDDAKYECDICNYTCSRLFDYNRHLRTARHLKKRENQENSDKPNDEILSCIACNYVCKYKSEYDRHMISEKHIAKVNSNTLFENGREIRENGRENAKIKRENQENSKHVCKCGKSYASRSALWYHKKRCIITDIETTEKVNRVFPISHTFLAEPDDNMDMVATIEAMVNEKVEKERDSMMEQARREAADKAADTSMFKQLLEAQAEAHAEQTRQLVEAISLKESQIITNNNTTNNNNQFNLNVFLNEDCKDAYTLKEVINSIECTVTDLDRMDKDGYAATVVRKIMESIQDMSITERPIHCTDARRNTVCVKNETGWERNEAALKSLNNSVYKVGRLLGNIVDDWRDTYPDHFRGSDFRREQYHRLITNILKVSDGDVEARIASKVCKGVILDRKAAMKKT